MKKVLYSFIAASLLAFGLTSCDPQDSDDHSLGGVDIPQEALSLGVSQDEEAKQTVFTFTNNSQALDGVNYKLSTNGSKLVDFPVGSTTTLAVKTNGTVTAVLYAFSRKAQRDVKWSQEIDRFVVASDKQWLGFDEDDNLLADWVPNNNSWFSPSDWSGGLNPGLDGNPQSGITFTIPEGTGDSQWQAQVHLENNGITLSAGKTYDFSVAIEASADMVGDGVTVKPQKLGDDGTFFSEARHKIRKGLNVISLAGCTGFDGEFKLALDFAGAPIGSEFTIKRIYLSEHNANNASSDTWAFDFKSDDNILKEAALTPEFWFSPGDWSGGLTPESEGNQELFEVTVPEGMGDTQWQGQIHLYFRDVNVAASKKWDFSVVVKADHDIPGLTMKPQQSNDDNVFFDASRYDVAANTATSFTYTDQAGFDSGFQLCIDVAGAPAGTKVQIYGIYLGEHK